MSRSQLISGAYFLSHHDVSGAISDCPLTSTIAPTPKGETTSDRRRSCLIRCNAHLLHGLAHLECDIWLHGSHRVPHKPTLTGLPEAFEERFVIGFVAVVTQTRTCFPS